MMWIFQSPNVIVSLVVVVLLCWYYLVDGYVDARHFNREPNKNEHYVHDIHIDLVARRVIVWLIAIFATGLPIVFATILMFPFIHDGAYYSERNHLNGLVYPEGWSAEPSSTSTAKLNFSYRTRRMMALAGVIILVAALYMSIVLPSLQR